MVSGIIPFFEKVNNLEHCITDNSSSWKIIKEPWEASGIEKLYHIRANFHNVNLPFSLRKDYFENQQWLVIQYLLHIFSFFIKCQNRRKLELINKQKFVGTLKKKEEEETVVVNTFSGNDMIHDLYDTRKEQ